MRGVLGLLGRGACMCSERTAVVCSRLTLHAGAISVLFVCKCVLKAGLPGSMAVDVSLTFLLATTTTGSRSGSITA